MDEQLAAELLAMKAEDPRVRDELARDGSLFDGYHPRMEEVHRRNVARLHACVYVDGPEFLHQTSADAPVWDKIFGAAKLLNTCRSADWLHSYGRNFLGPLTYVLPRS